MKIFLNLSWAVVEYAIRNTQYAIRMLYLNKVQLCKCSWDNMYSGETHCGVSSDWTPVLWSIYVIQRKTNSSFSRCWNKEAGGNMSSWGIIDHSFLLRSDIIIVHANFLIPATVYVRVIFLNRTSLFAVQSWCLPPPLNWVDYNQQKVLVFFGCSVQFLVDYSL